MPRFTPYTSGHLDRALHRLADAVYTPVAELTVHAWRTSEPVPFAQRESGQPLHLVPGDVWGDLFDCAWFRFTGTVPAAAAGRRVVLLLDVHGELCVVDEAGMPQRGLTTVASVFDLSLGMPGKRVLPWLAEADGGEPVEVWADGGCNDLFGHLQGNGTLKEARIAVCDEEVGALYHDVEVLADFLKVLPEDGPRYAQVRVGLQEVAHLLGRPEGRDGGPAAVAAEGRAILAPLLARRGGDPSLRISAVGHAHMDLAWLWPIRETIRKGARTFATAIELFDRYPDYVFGASQPQYFQWMKDHYPALFERIRDRVADGRIEPQGCMWVEADTNLSGGEALVRQILHGLRFWQREFGVDVTYLWLPDVFGYSGALPQILRKAGIDVFATQKLSWSLINRFPHHSFRWQGIDGSQVAAHMLPEDTYNGPALPRSVRRIETNYRDKDVSGRALMVFGIGDGGGGPGEEHLERLMRIRDLEGLSPVQPESAAAFFERWREDVPRFPVWVGELYLERHQGTLTTQGANKRWNRRLELSLRDLELAAVLAARHAGVPYPAAPLEAIWQEVLLYQFHDILPGSSIRRVYEECRLRYAALSAQVEALLAERLAALAARVDASGAAEPVLVFNSLSWARTEWVEVGGGRWLEAWVPPLGWTVVDAAAGVAAPALPLVATRQQLENALVRVGFDGAGRVTSAFHKGLGREAIPAGAWGNELLVFDDPGDAWDFPMDYAETAPRRPERIAAAARVDGPRAILEQTLRIGQSQLTQRVVVTAGSPRVDFRTTARWRERAAMLRVRFPVDVHADEATFEIQFGHLRRPTHRNTTWDLARDEVAAHKWADLSQRDFGAALLNDGKYGHRAKGRVLDLNLIRSVPYPGPRRVAEDAVAPDQPHGHYTDQGDHEWTYSFLPHGGDAVAGGVVRAGYELNVPLRIAAVGASRGGLLPPRASLLEVDAPGVVVEAVKAAEDGRGDTIVRLYESEGRTVRARVRAAAPPAAAHIADLMERPIEPAAVDAEGSVAVAFRPFEIHTLRLRLAPA